MISIQDIVNIFLPVLSHSPIWLTFLGITNIILLSYAYPYIKQPRKIFRFRHLGVPAINLGLLYIFTKMLEGVVYRGSIVKVDLWFSEILFPLYPIWITKIALIITTFGNGYVIAALFVIALVILLLKKRFRYAILSTFTILGALVLEVIIKVLVHRTRPLGNLEVISPGYFSGSFPSGHAIMGIVFVCLLIHSFKNDIKYRAIKYPVIISFFSFFVVVGITRVIIRAHWFSDVVAGISLGLSWFMVVLLVEKYIPDLRKKIKKEKLKA